MSQKNMTIQKQIHVYIYILYPKNVVLPCNYVYST